MKKTINTFFTILFLVSCTKVYHVATRKIIINIKEIESVMDSTIIRTSRVAEIPKRYLRLLRNPLPRLTDDTIIACKDKFMLLKEFGYSRETILGYVIYSKPDSYKDYKYSTCVIFKVVNDSLQLNQYRIPDTINTFESARPYLNFENLGLFGGKSITKKKNRRKR